MKKCLILLACAVFAGTATAQTNAAATPDLREHVCAAACAGEAHAYLHGEKGHACTPTCAGVTTEKKAGGCCAGKKTGTACARTAKVEGHADAHAEAHAGKDHVCTTACADGNHTYACGEKGHACGEACAHKD